MTFPELPFSEQVSIAEEHLGGPLEWQGEGSRGWAYCSCPGKAFHGNKTDGRATRIYIGEGEAPNLVCQHTSCDSVVAETIREIRSAIGKAKAARKREQEGPEAERKRQEWLQRRKERARQQQREAKKWKVEPSAPSEENNTSPPSFAQGFGGQKKSSTQVANVVTLPTRPVDAWEADGKDGWQTDNEEGEEKEKVEGRRLKDEGNEEEEEETTATTTPPEKVAVKFQDKKRTKNVLELKSTTPEYEPGPGEWTMLIPRRGEIYRASWGEKGLEKTDFLGKEWS